jgi:hypothetical protein
VCDQGGTARGMRRLGRRSSSWGQMAAAQATSFGVDDNGGARTVSVKGSGGAPKAREETVDGVILTVESDSTWSEDGVGGYGLKMTRWALVQAAAIDAARTLAAGDRRGDSNGEQRGDDGNFGCGNRGPGIGYDGATAARPMLGGGWLIGEVGAEEGRG